MTHRLALLLLLLAAPAAASETQAAQEAVTVRQQEAKEAQAELKASRKRLEAAKTRTRAAQLEKKASAKDAKAGDPDERDVAKGGIVYRRAAQKHAKLSVDWREARLAAARAAVKRDKADLARLQAEEEARNQPSPVADRKLGQSYMKLGQARRQATQKQVVVDRKRLKVHKAQTDAEAKAPEGAKPLPASE